VLLVVDEEWSAVLLGELADVEPPDRQTAGGRDLGGVREKAER